MTPPTDNVLQTGHTGHRHEPSLRGLLRPRIGLRHPLGTGVGLKPPALVVQERLVLGPPRQLGASGAFVRVLQQGVLDVPLLQHELVLVPSAVG